MMDIDNQLLFFFSGLGVFNGFLTSLYFLFFAKPRNIQYKLFAFLILMLSIRIGKSVLFHFVGDLPKVILQIGLSACVFIGPFLLFYIRSVQTQAKKLEKLAYIQLSGWLIIVLAVGVIFSYPSHPDIWNTYLVKGIYGVWIFYILVTTFQLNPSIRKLFASSNKLTLVEKWLLTLFTTNVLICLVFNTVLYFGFPSYVSGPITFSFGFYVLALFLLSRSKRMTLIQGKKQGYNNRKIQPQQLKKIKSRLKKLMEEEKWYKRSDLKLEQLAESLEISPHILSQYLNENLNKPFSLFVNEYRIHAACTLLGTNHQFTLEGIGYEVGFRSKSNFYATFKKLKNCTPSQFAKDIA